MHFSVGLASNLGRPVWRPQKAKNIPPRWGRMLPPRWGRIQPQDKGQKSKHDPTPGAVKSHWKTSRKWAVFSNLWGAHGQSPEDVKDTPPVASKGQNVRKWRSKRPKGKEMKPQKAKMYKMKLEKAKMKAQKAKIKGNERPKWQEIKAQKAKMKGNEGPKGKNERKWRPKRPKCKEMKAQKAKMKGNEAKKAPRIPPLNFTTLPS